MLSHIVFSFRTISLDLSSR